MCFKRTRDRIAKFKMRVKSIKKKIRMRQSGGGDAAITDQSNTNARKTKMLVRLLQGASSGSIMSGSTVS